MNRMTAASLNQRKASSTSSSLNGRRTSRLVSINSIKAVSHIRGNLPCVTPFIFHHTTTISIGRVQWLFNSTHSSLDSTSIGRVGIANVYVEKSRHNGSHAGLANHDQRIADPDDGGAIVPIFSRCIEYGFKELYKLFRISSHDSWRNSVPAFRDKMRLVGCFFHRNILPMRVRAKISPQSGPSGHASPRGGGLACAAAHPVYAHCSNDLDLL